MGSWTFSLRTKRPSFFAHGVPIMGVIWGVMLWISWSFGESMFFKLFCAGLAATLSVFVWLLSFWSVSVAAVFNTTTASVKEATLVLGSHKGVSGFSEIHRDNERVFVDFQERRFVWEDGSFRKLRFPVDSSFVSLTENKGVTAEEAVALRNKYGTNALSLPVPSFRQLYREHALAPFFVLQIFFVLLWLMDEYWMYAVLTGGMLGLMEALTVWKRLKTIRFLRSMIQTSSLCSVSRGGKWTKLPSAELVPGDLFQVSAGIVPCDAVLVSGSCVVNESTLTGENVALLKDSVAQREGSDRLSLSRDRVHVLFGGTSVLQLSSAAPVRALAIRTGFASSQGKVLRAIAFASQPVSANSVEALLFVFFLLAFAIVAAAYVLIDGLSRADKSPYKLMLNCIIILTSVVPPELPIELALAVTTSLSALRLLRVFCTEPFRIPLAGKLDVCCFDKTGTLTRDDLNFVGVSGGGDDLTLNTTSKAISDDALVVIGGCQSLSRVEGKVIGDPLECAVFEKTGFKLSGEKSSQLAAKKLSVEMVYCYHFSAQLRRMTTVAIVSVAASRPEYRVCVKGAPEVVRSLLRSDEQTSSFDSVYRYFAQQGFRVIALASRSCPEFDSKHAVREDLESNLSFNGFVVFECLIRPGTASVLELLANAGMVNVMITGDSELTAIAVAAQTKMSSLPPIVFCEKTNTWRDAFGGHMEKFEETKVAALRKKHTLCVLGQSLSVFPSSLLVFVTVFARCSPAHKEQVVTRLKSRHVHTLMCGDGTNDVSALKQADVGIALVFQEDEEVKISASEAKKKAQPAPKQPVAVEKVTGILIIDRILQASEGQEEQSNMNMGDASIAAPFTVRAKNIAPVLDVCRQGRCTLVTTLSMYFILALNSLIAAFSLSALYLQGVRFGDAQMTVGALFSTAAFLFISRATPLQSLSPLKPRAKIFSFYFMSSLLGQFAVHLLSLLFAVSLASESLGFVAPTKDEFAPHIMNTCVFIVSFAMQLSSFLTNYQGHPFMQSLSENKGLRGVLIGGYVVLGFCLLGVLNTAFGLVSLSGVVRSRLVGLVLLDAVGAIAAERIAALLFTKYGHPIKL